MGAYVNVLAAAEDRDEYTFRAQAAVLNELELDVLGIEDAEPMEERLQSDAPEEGLLTLAEQAGTSGEVMLGTFHTYGPEGES